MSNVNNLCKGSSNTFDRVAALAFVAKHGLAVAPIPGGQKAPVGIVPNVYDDCSKDPAQHAQWSADHPDANFALLAGASGIVIVDIDVKVRRGRQGNRPSKEARADRESARKSVGRVERVVHLARVASVCAVLSHSIRRMARCI